MQNARALEDYVTFFEKLSPRSVKLLEKYVAFNVRFTDPFNDVMGATDMERVLSHMFTQVGNPKFKVHEYGWGTKNQELAYIKWTFSYVLPKSGNKDSFEGVSEVMFDAKGKIVSHVDYWDPTKPIYLRVPILRWILSKVLTKLKVV